MHSKKVIPKQVHGKQTGQRGRKFCPSCNASVGVRTAKCSCGHEFNVSVRSSKATPEKVSRRHGKNLTTILTPAGEPPVRLDDKSVDGVRSWAAAIRLHGERNGKNYTTSAVVYFLRYFVDMSAENYTILKEACENTTQPI